MQPSKQNTRSTHHCRHCMISFWLPFAQVKFRIVGDLLRREKGINQHLSASLGNGGSNAVQITLTIDGDLASTIVQKEIEEGKGISLND